MPGPLYHVGAAAMCAHAGQVSVVASNPRVQVGGTPVAVLTDAAVIVCTGQGVTPPCTAVRWLLGATRVLANGVPVLLQTSAGIGLNPAPAGPITIVATQPRVVAT